MISKAVLASRAHWTGSMQPYLQLNKLSNGCGLDLWERTLSFDVKTSDRNSRKQLGVGACPFDSCLRICICICICTHACMHACLTTSSISTMLIDVDIKGSDRNNSKQQGVGPCPFNS